MSREAIEQLHKNWQKNLFDNYDAIEHLREARGIRTAGTIKALELGLAEVPEKENLPPEIFKALKSFGLTDPGIAGTVSLPLRRRTGMISNFCFLSLNGKGDQLIRKGGVINGKAFRAFRTILVTDNLPDFFTYFQNVKENIVPLIESERMPVDFIESVINSEVEEIILVNDSPYWDPLRARLSKCDVKVYGISLPEGKGVGEYLRKASGMKLVAYIEGEKAKLVKERVRESGQEESKDDVNVPEYLKFIDGTGEVRFEGTSATLGTGVDRSYRVRGFNRDGFEKMVQVSLEVDGRVFPDKVDLSRSRSRVNFANTAAAEFEMSDDLVRNDLAFIYKKLDGIQEERYREKTGMGEKEVYVITPDDLSKAIDRLTKRDLLDEILMKDTERLGYVEEEVNKKLFYLSAISRLTGNPLSVLDISPPGTGKSFGMSSIMDLVPPDEVLRYSRLSPNALYYKSEEGLRGRVLYIEELVGMEESLEPIRMLLSSGELSVSVVEKDPRTGQLRTAERRIRAEIPILSSGVRDILDDETLSRFVLTYNDVTEQHLKRVMKAQAFKYSLEGEKAGLLRERTLKKHRDIQKSFDPGVRVVNGYHGRIMMDHRLHIVTRKQDQYLKLIHNIAFIRQHSREKKKETDRYGNEFVYIDVREEDIRTANEIAVYVFKYSRGSLSKTLSDVYDDIRRLLEEKVKKSRKTISELGVTKRELMESYALPETTARRYLDELVRHEYLVKIKESRNRQHIYRLLFNTDKENDGLMLFDPGKLN